MLPVSKPPRGWHGLAELVADLHRHRAAGPLPPGDLREQAAELAARAWGVYQVLSRPLLVNLGALALSMPRLTVHRLSAGAVRLVHETDLHSLPGEPPTLLRRAWIVEPRRPESEPLFGRTASLGGYPLGDAIYLIGLDWPDGVWVTRWRPHWEARDLDSTIERDDSPLVQDVDAHRAWSREAARFAVVLGLLLDAQGAPIRIQDDTHAPTRQRGHGRRNRDSDWLVRRVYLREERTLQATPTRQRGTGQPLDLSGRIPVVVPVTGHLKRQPVGPGRSQRKWIYVRSYEARRWIAPRPLVVDVRPPHRADAAPA